MKNVLPTFYVGVKKNTDHFVIVSGQDIQVMKNNPRLLALKYYYDTVTPIYQQDEINPAQPQEEVPVENLLDLTVNDPTSDDELHGYSSPPRKALMPPLLIPAPEELRVVPRPDRRRRPDNPCWNCEGDYFFRDCPEEDRGKFCYLCVRKDVTKADCPTPKCVNIRRNDVLTGRNLPPTARVPPGRWVSPPPAPAPKRSAEPTEVSTAKRIFRVPKVSAMENDCIVQDEDTSASSDDSSSSEDTSEFGPELPDAEDDVAPEPDGQPVHQAIDNVALTGHAIAEGDEHRYEDQESDLEISYNDSDLEHFFG